MNRSLAAGAAAAVFLALVGPAGATDLLGNHVLIMAPNAGPASQLVGAPVYDSNNDCVGRVAYVILGPSGNEVAAVVVSVPMFMYRRPVAIPFHEIAQERGRLIVDQTKREIQSSVAFIE